MIVVVQDKPHGLAGRPSNRKGKGLKAPSSTRSIRLPVVVWDRLEAVASEYGLTVNAYISETLRRDLAIDTQP